MHAVSKTAESSWVMAAPLVVAELAESETFLGEALADALASSRSGARDAGDVVRKQILEKARSKRWSTFVSGTLACDVEMDSNGVRFFPARSARRSLVPAGAPTFELETTALADALGAALKKAFRSMEPRRRVRSGTAVRPGRRQDSPSPEPPPEAPSAHRLQRSHSPARRRRQERP